MSDFANEHYLIIQILHLLSAMTFGGVVIFEVLILESLHGRFSKATMMEIESGIIRRARQFMPVVIVVLYSTGILLLRAHFPDLSIMPQSSFGRLLMVKVAFAAVVLVCFVSAMTLHFLNKMNPSIFKAIHLIVFSCVIAIVVLAKAMFSA
ncbi:hypothetical protein [Bradyrhizobium sp. CCBAU 53338]|uniref:hypothetical protein n=1 Tax=Bradyrhizobium sp. CCBAU 53338 TaxID=1325111 RepID=UPI00188CD2E8|nr:hypothetical protein [Bradyrhizobium sp. CCBAU 53338]QOZ55386.1 hypothetical protein XH90_31440 [Bradyrhizobium sp. CCBAU 53338]